MSSGGHRRRRSPPEKDNKDHKDNKDRNDENGKKDWAVQAYYRTKTKLEDTAKEVDALRAAAATTDRQQSEVSLASKITSGINDSVKHFLAAVTPSAGTPGPSNAGAG